MAGEWGIKDIRSKVAEIETVLAEGVTRIDVSASTDGIEMVGNELRLKIDALPLAPEN